MRRAGSVIRYQDALGDGCCGDRSLFRHCLLKIFYLHYHGAWENRVAGLYFCCKPEPPGLRRVT